MQRLAVIVLCLGMSALSARAAHSEFAFLSFPDGGIRWVDKAGARTDVGKGSTAEVFTALSGEDAKRNLTLWPEPGSDMTIMKEVKQMFDPEGLLNAGRLYGVI